MIECNSPSSGDAGLQSSRESALPAIFDGFYEAALEPSLWRGALTAGAKALGVTGLSLMAEPGVRAPSVGPEAFDELASEYIAQEWYRRNERFFAYLDSLAKGRGSGRYHVMSNAVVFPDDPGMRRLPIQQEFFHRFKVKSFVGARLSGEGAGRIYLSVDRVEREGEFSDGEVKLVELLAAHIDRALQISLALEDQAAAGGLRSLEAVGKAAIMVGRDLAVVGVNARAEALFGHGVEVKGGRLAATDRTRQPALERLVAHAAGELDLGRQPPEPVALPRASGRPLIAHAAPYRSATSDVFRSVRAIVLLTNVDAAPPPPSEALLRDAFGLSRAEARLAAKLAAGATLEDCAKAWNLSLNTVRNQLSSAFSKTGVRRQADFVTLIAKLGEG